jgi:hypothetical protein
MRIWRNLPVVLLSGAATGKARSEFARLSVHNGAPRIDASAVALAALAGAFVGLT